MRGKIIIARPMLVLVFLATSVAAQETDKKAVEHPPRLIQVIAKNFEFEPSEIHVKSGEKIQLKLFSVDRTHGIHVDPFPSGGRPSTAPGISFTYGDDCLKLKKGMTETLEFTAEAPGTYLFLCCKKCGSGHGRMKGKIVIDP